MTVVATYTIQISRERTDDNYLLLDADQLNGWINEAEQNLTDLLPDGYQAFIDRWDDDREHGFGLDGEDNA